MKVVFTVSKSYRESLLERTYTVEGGEQIWKRGGKYFSWTESGGRKEISSEVYFQKLSGSTGEPPKVKRDVPKIDRKDLPNASDEDLAMLAAEGDDRATDIILRRYEPLVYKLTNKYFLKGGDKDDLSQNGMIGLWDGIKTYDPDKNPNFKKYAAMVIDKRLQYTIGADNTKKNQMNNYASSMDAPAPGKEGSDDGRTYGDTLASKELSPEEQYLGKVGAERLLNFMKNELAPKERDAIFRFINGSSIQEIADDMGVSYKSIENAIGRARYKIKDFRAQNECTKVREGKRVVFRRLRESKSPDEQYKDYLVQHINGIKEVYHDTMKPLLVDEGISDDLLVIIDKNIDDHDKSKYSDLEWNAYRDHFYDPNKNPRSGNSIFDKAWNHHQKSNPHHWQYWVLVNDVDDPQVQAIDMPLEYVIEMLCDWSSAGSHYGNTAYDWYDKNRDRMILSDNTRELVEKYIDYLK